MFALQRGVKQMNRIRRTLVVAIIGLVILGFGLISAVEAGKPPPPGGYPDAERILLWDYNVIDRSDASYVLAGWVYWVEPGYDETELFPQPIRVQMWITEDGSETETEIKLSRHAVGNGQPTLVSPIEVRQGSYPLIKH